MKENLSPLISVVIPTRQRPSLLMNRSLPSALAQSYSNLEVVVVVDGPDPETVSVLTELASRDVRVRPVFLPHNVGGSDARNAGVEAARGEWIAFLDDDDEMLPHNLEQHLEVVVQARREGRPWPISVCGSITRTPSGDTLNPPRLPDANELLGDYLLARRSFREKPCSFMTSALFCQRSLLLHHPFRSGLLRHQDWDWVVSVNVLPEVSFHFSRQIATIWYYGERRKQISNSTNWAYSLAWILKVYKCGLVSRKALAGFLNVSVADYAKRGRDYRAVLPTAKAMIMARPRAFEWLIFALIWLTPDWIRRRVRRARPHSVLFTVSAPDPSVPQPNIFLALPQNISSSEQAK